MNCDFKCDLKPYCIVNKSWRFWLLHLGPVCFQLWFKYDFKLYYITIKSCNLCLLHLSPLHMHASFKLHFKPHCIVLKAQQFLQIACQSIFSNFCMFVGFLCTALRSCMFSKLHLGPFLHYCMHILSLILHLTIACLALLH